MKKLEHLYYLINYTIRMDVEEFWYGYDIESSELSINTDDLINFFIYIIIKTDYALIIPEIKLIKSLITQNVEQTIRGKYFNDLSLAATVI